MLLNFLTTESNIETGWNIRWPHNWCLFCQAQQPWTGIVIGCSANNKETRSSHLRHTTLEKWLSLEQRNTDQVNKISETVITTCTKIANSASGHAYIVARAIHVSFTKVRSCKNTEYSWKPGVRTSFCLLQWIGQPTNFSPAAFVTVAGEHWLGYEWHHFEYFVIYWDPVDKNQSQDIAHSRSASRDVCVDCSPYDAYKPCSPYSPCHLCITTTEFS